MKRPSPEDMDKFNEEMLRNFITKASGLSGMVLVGIREDDDHTSVEVSAGGTTHNLYQAASAILESLIQDNKIENEMERFMIGSVVKMLNTITGTDGPDSIDEEPGGGFDKNRVN